MKPQELLELIGDMLMEARKRKDTLNEEYEDIAFIDTYPTFNLIVMQDGTEFEMIIKKPLKKKHS
jgi:hypothetical protein